MTPARGGHWSRIAHTGRLSRLSAISAAGARMALRKFASSLQAAVSPRQRREAIREAARRKSSEDLTATLAAMKGLAAKLGQMASYLDESLPQATREALEQLQADMPAMAPEVAARVVTESLGRHPAKLFAKWEPEPFAAASIGQVHRAETRSGIQVAVKVQYPGISGALDADLSNASFLFHAIKFVFPTLDPQPILEELYARLSEEIDYSIEAANQQLFADHYRGHPFIAIPSVVHELSSDRVLTTEMASGARFSEMLSWSPEERNMAAEAIFRFVFRSLYSLHAFNGDPHPGNYLFHPGGRVTFLDFGLVKRFTPEEARMFHDMVTTMVTEQDYEGFRNVIERAGLLERGAPVSTEEVVGYFRTFYELVREPVEREVTPELATAMVRSFTETSNPVTKYASVPSAFVIIQRINLGLYALLAKIGARANWRLIAEELWPHVQGPPSTPLGEEEAEWLSRTSSASR